MPGPGPGPGALGAQAQAGLRPGPAARGPRSGAPSPGPNAAARGLAPSPKAWGPGLGMGTVTVAGPSLTPGLPDPPIDTLADLKHHAHMKKPAILFDLNPYRLKRIPRTKAAQKHTNMSGIRAREGAHTVTHPPLAKSAFALYLKWWSLTDGPNRLWLRLSHNLTLSRAGREHDGGIPGPREET